MKYFSKNTFLERCERVNVVDLKSVLEKYIQKLYSQYLLPFQTLYFCLFLASGWCVLKQYQRGRSLAGIWSHR